MGLAVLATAAIALVAGCAGDGDEQRVKPQTAVAPQPIAQAGDGTADTEPRLRYAMDVDAPDWAQWDRALDDVYALGARWLPVYINWNDVEKKRDEYDFSYSDSTIEYYRSKGFGVYALVRGAPRWHCAVQPNPEQLEDVVDCGEPRARPFARFLRVLAERYRGVVSDWGVLGEANTQWEYVSPERYARILEEAHAALEAVDPGNRVIAAWPCTCPGDAAANESPPSDAPGAEYTPGLVYIERVLGALDGKQALDVVGLQAYRAAIGPLQQRTVHLLQDGRVVPQQMTLEDELVALEGLLARYGYEQARVLLILGWGTEDGLAEGWLTSEELQARYLDETLTLLEGDPDLAGLVDLFQLYKSHDTLPDQWGFSSFGLIDGDWRRKPAACVYVRHALGQACP